MTVLHPRTGKKVRLSSSHKLFGNEREVVDEAWPGDIIGLVGHADFGIGDTLTTDPKIVYKEMPRFTPEAFSWLHNPNTAKYKQFRTGPGSAVAGRRHPGACNCATPPIKAPLLAAVGPLQFEVVQYRLESEYGAASRLEAAPWTVVRWLAAGLTEAGSGRAFPADRRAPGLRHGPKSRHPLRQRLVGELLRANQPQSRAFQPAGGAEFLTASTDKSGGRTQLCS